MLVLSGLKFTLEKKLFIVSFGGQEKSKMRALSIPRDEMLKAMPIVWVASIALGPTIETICSMLTLASFLIRPEIYHQSLKSMLTEWYLSLLAIVIWGSLSLFWAPEISHEAWSNLRKVYRLLLLPFIIQAFIDEDHCLKALDAF